MTEFLIDNGWSVKRLWFEVKGIKDSYYPKNPIAHGFYLAVKK